MLTNMICALKVRDTQEKGWFKTPTKILKTIKGLSYEYAQDGMIYISGRADPQKILKRIGKHGKKVELYWIKTVDQHGRAPPPMHMSAYPPPMPMSTYPPYHQRGYCPPHPPMPYHNYDPQVPHYY